MDDGAAAPLSLVGRGLGEGGRTNPKRAHPPHPDLRSDLSLPGRGIRPNVARAPCYAAARP